MPLVSQLVPQQVTFDPRAALVAVVIVVAVLSATAGLIVVVRAQRATTSARHEAAAARQDRDRALVARARAQERADLAHEAHDVLGHRLTLVAVSAGALEVSLPDEGQRARAAEVRSRAAEAVSGLDDMVAALSDDAPAMPDRVDVVPLVRQVVDRLRRSAVDVDLVVGPDELPVDAFAGRTLERVLEEACTNAVRHAPGARVEVRLECEPSGWVVLDVGNDVACRAHTGASGGRGLAVARERVALVGGVLEHRLEAGRFRLVARLPVVMSHGRHGAEGGRAPDDRRPAGDLDLARRRRGGVALMVGGPVVVVAIGLALAATHVLVVAVASRLEPETFALVQVGEPRAVAEVVLPSVQMMDPPRQRPGCVYHEADVSLFDRDDVFEVCFADGFVTSTSVIPAP